MPTRCGNQNGISSSSISCALGAAGGSADLAGAVFAVFLELLAKLKRSTSSTDLDAVAAFALLIRIGAALEPSLHVDRAPLLAMD